MPIGDVAWVELSTIRVRGGIAGRPREMIDIKATILSALERRQVVWELREGAWSIEGIFHDEPLQLIRIANPFVAASNPAEED